MGMGVSELLPQELQSYPPFSKGPLLGEQGKGRMSCGRRSLWSLTATLQRVTKEWGNRREKKPCLGQCGKGVSKYLYLTQHPQLNCVLLKVPDLTTIFCMFFFGHPPLRVLHIGTKDETCPPLANSSCEMKQILEKASMLETA